MKENKVGDRDLACPARREFRTRAILIQPPINAAKGIVG